MDISINWYSANLGDGFAAGLIGGMTPVPEPSSIVIMLLLCAGAFILVRRNPRLFCGCSATCRVGK